MTNKRRDPETILKQILKQVQDGVQDMAQDDGKKKN
jgi:hypothetical protein